MNVGDLVKKISGHSNIGETGLVIDMHTNVEGHIILTVNYSKFRDALIGTIESNQTNWLAEYCEVISESR